MATLKYVYFCESDPSKWFEKQKDAERFDKVVEVTDFIAGDVNTDYPLYQSIVERIMERYEITKRYDYKSAEDAKE